MTDPYATRRQVCDNWTEDGTDGQRTDDDYGTDGDGQTKDRRRRDGRRDGRRDERTEDDDGDDGTRLDVQRTDDYGTDLGTVVVVKSTGVMLLGSRPGRTMGPPANGRRRDGRSHDVKNVKPRGNTKTRSTKLSGPKQR